jgi:hypothetical protein
MRNLPSIACGTTEIFSAGTLKKCKMSRFEASDAVTIRSDRLAALHIAARAYA